MAPEEFARLTGIGVDDLRDWETSRTLPSRALDRYLRLLASNPENVKLLEALQAASSGPSGANGATQPSGSVAGVPE